MAKKPKNILRGLSSRQDFERYEGISKPVPLAEPKAPDGPVEITRKKRGPTRVKARIKRSPEGELKQEARTKPRR